MGSGEQGDLQKTALEVGEVGKWVREESEGVMVESV